MTDRQSTHAPGCWAWGPRHYECALREMALLVAEWKRAAAAQGEAKARAERLEEALREARDAIEEWAGYASDYFREKHDLAGDLAKIDALLRDQEEGK